MKKLAFLLPLLFAVQACAEPVEHEDLSNIPPTYDYEEGQFTINLPMVCTEDASQVFEYLEVENYAMVFLGQTESLNGSDLFLSVFLNRQMNDYYILLTNKETGGVCEVTSGFYGQAFPLDHGI